MKKLATVLVAAVLGAACGSDEPVERTGTAVDALGSAWEHETYGTPKAKVAWDDPTASSTVAASTTLGATLRNLSSSSMDLRVTLTAKGLDDRTRTVDMGTITVGANSSRPLGVTLSSLPVQSVGSPSQMVLTAVGVGTSTPVFASSTPMSYEFTGTYGSVILRGRTSAAFTANVSTIEELNSPTQPWMGALANLIGKVTNARGVLVDVGTMMPMQGDAGVILGSSIGIYAPWLYADYAQLPYSCCPEPVTYVCGNWPTDFVDSGLGEDEMTTQGPQQYRARYSQYWVIDDATNAIVQNVNNSPGAGILDQNGCTPVPFKTDHLIPDTWYRLELQTWLQVGNRYFPVKNNAINNQMVHVKNKFKLPSNWQSGNFAVDAAPADLGPETNVAAVVGLALKKHDVSLMANGWHTIYAEALQCPDGFPGSCNDSGDIYFVDPADTQSKTIIAHEFGHVYQLAVNGLTAHTVVGQGVVDQGIDVPVNETDLCKCKHVTPALGQSHCLQSRHPAGLPIAEGFAHWFAARTFNDAPDPGCKFAYYKEFLNPPGIIPDDVVGPPHVVDCIAQTKWMFNNCLQDDDGVELDWLQFFWRVMRPVQDATTIADMQAIFLGACGGTPCDNADNVSYKGAQGLLAAAQTQYMGAPLKLQFFVDRASDHGVNH